jgi:hypothetical protein
VIEPEGPTPAVCVLFVAGVAANVAPVQRFTVIECHAVLANVPDETVIEDPPAVTIPVQITA